MTLRLKYKEHLLDDKIYFGRAMFCTPRVHVTKFSLRITLRLKIQGLVFKVKLSVHSQVDVKNIQDGS